MRQTDQLTELEFTTSKVKVADWDLRIPTSPKVGPFCRLIVEPSDDAAPDVDSAALEGPGVYAWVVGSRIVFVGHSADLRGIAHPQSPFSTVSPASADGGAARINNLLNAAFKAEHRISWWWRSEESIEAAAQTAGQLVAELDPMGNKLTRTRSAAPRGAGATRAAKATAVPKAAAAPKVRAPKAPAKYDPERVVPKALVCPSCFIQVSLATGWCDNCDEQVAS